MRGKMLKYLEIIFSALVVLVLVVGSGGSIFMLVKAGGNVQQIIIGASQLFMLWVCIIVVSLIIYTLIEIKSLLQRSVEK